MNDIEQILIETVTYSVSFDGQALFCRMCGTATRRREHVEARYCSICGCFHDNQQLEKHLAAASAAAVAK